MEEGKVYTVYKFSLGEGDQYREYIGCTGDLDYREFRHNSDLRRGEHNILVQPLYDSLYPNRDYKVELIPIETFNNKEEAYQYEKELIESLDKEILNITHTSRSSEVFRSSILNNPERLEKNRKRLASKEFNEKRLNGFYEGLKEGWDHFVGCYIEGVEYISINDAARAYGIGDSGVLFRIQSNQPEYANWQYLKDKGTPKQVLDLDENKVFIEGIEYNSVQEAASTLKVSRDTVMRRIESLSPKWKEWKTYKDRHKDKPIEVVSDFRMVYDDIVFETPTHLAKLLKVSPEAIRARIRSKDPRFRGYRWYKDMGTEKELDVKSCLYFNGNVYYGATEAERLLGLNEGMVLRRIRSPSYPDWMTYQEAVDKGLIRYGDFPRHPHFTGEIY